MQVKIGSVPTEHESKLQLSPSKSILHSAEWMNSFRRHSKKRNIPTLHLSFLLRPKPSTERAKKRSRMPYSLLVPLYSYKKIWGEDRIMNANLKTIVFGFF